MSYVYAGEYEGRIVYVGKGQGARINHLNSGRSSCYEANRLHFAGGHLRVYKIADDMLDQDAYELEQLIICELQPEWNIVGIRSASTLPVEPKPRKIAERDKSDNATSRYFGVSFKSGRWLARCKLGGKAIHISSHDTEMEAAEARDEFVVDNGLELRLNF